MQHILYLLKNYASVNATDFRGHLPIHAAVQNGRHEVARLLLSCGAYYTVKTFGGKTLMELAPEKDEVMRKLLRDADVWQKVSETSNDAPIHMAVRGKNMLALSLLSYTDDIDMTNGDGKTALQLAEEMNFQEAYQWLKNCRE